MIMLQNGLTVGSGAPTRMVLSYIPFCKVNGLIS